MSEDSLFSNMLDSIAEELGDPRRKRVSGHWMPYAWAVRALVDRGYTPRLAAQEVLKRGGREELNHGNVECVRVAYYTIRNKPWPAGMLASLGKRSRSVGNHDRNEELPKEEDSVIEDDKSHIENDGNEPLEYPEADAPISESVTGEGKLGNFDEPEPVDMIEEFEV